jgi:AAA family ATP:ADP antiporter
MRAAGVSGGGRECTGGAECGGAALGKVLAIRTFAAVHALVRFLGLQDASPAERRAAAWTGAMFFCALAATFVVRPLRDQFAVASGVSAQVWLYSLTLLVTALVVPPFWWLANRVPSRRFVPIVLHVAALACLGLAAGLATLDGYDWSATPWLGEVFWAGYSALNVVVPALVWIHAVERFGRDAARRTFGLIALGGTAGALAGSFAASRLAAHELPLWGYGVAAAALLLLAHGAFAMALPHCNRLRAAGGGAPAPAAEVARGGMFAGVQVLLRDGYVRRIGVYMMLLGMLATAFYAAQTELVGSEIAAASQQHRWLADAETYGQGLVLVLQLCCTGRLLQRVPAAWLLVSLPLVSIVGLSIWWLIPSAAAIFAVQVARRGAQFALEKPAREVLYTPLDLETKHKVKFLLDTFAFRLGDLGGAVLQVQMRERQFGAGAIVLVTVLVCVVWIALGVSLGRRRSQTGERAASPQRRSIS